MRSIQKVVIERAEGLTGDYTMKKVEFTGDTAEIETNCWLHEIAKTAPKAGGYDKTDVSVTLSNGQEHSFRFDMMHTSLSDNYTNIRQHLRRWFLFIARPETLPYIASNPRRLQRVQTMFIPEQKAAAASALDLIDADRV